MPSPSDTTSVIDIVWKGFNPTNEFIYLGMLAVALIISVFFNQKRTAKDIWGDMWPKLLFFAVVYAVLVIIVWSIKE